MDTKKHLYSTIIEQQKEKILKYETRISDLVRAYKSLTKEKDALQASFSALSAGNEKCKEKLANDIEIDKLIPNNNEVQPKSHIYDENQIRLLENKVLTLTSALQTLTEEKNKLELCTKNERKKILEDKNQVEEQFSEESENWLKEQRAYESKIKELKSKMIMFQHERDKEIANNLVMLREVETRLSKERIEKDRLEKSLDETMQQNRQLVFALSQKSHEKQQQKQVVDLQKELEQLRCRLKRAEEQCENPPILIALQSQMEQMKIKYDRAIEQERNRAGMADKKTRELAQLHEQRVASLELSLAELSFTASSCNNTKQNYISTIQSLKDKIAEITEENSNLNSVIRKTVGQTDKFEKSEEMLENFIEQWKCIKNILESEKISHSKNKILREIFETSEIIHDKCTEKIGQLENKIFELNKSSESNGNSSKYSIETSKNSSKNSAEIAETIEGLQEKIRGLRADSRNMQQRHNVETEHLKMELRNLRNSKEEQLNRQTHEHKLEMNELEGKLNEHCQRSLITLQEREDEIHRLTLQINELNKNAEIQPSTVAAALLSQVNSNAEGPTLHHLEDLARKDLEVSYLRKQKMQLEKSLRDLNMAMIDRQENMQDQVDQLHEQLERMQRNQSRVGENLEYLKNIVLQYMTSKDLESKLVILKAISAVLKFTAKETKLVKGFLSLWWWQNPGNPSGRTFKIANFNPDSKGARTNSLSNSRGGGGSESSSNRSSRISLGDFNIGSRNSNIGAGSFNYGGGESFNNDDKRYDLPIFEPSSISSISNKSRSFSIGDS